MSRLSTITPLTHPSLSGVQIFPLDGAIRGSTQRVLVKMEPGTRIPPHRHTVDATMDVVSGRAVVRSDNEDDGTEVGVGTRVHFGAHGLHGFEAGPEGFVFLSTNGGIVDATGNWDIDFGVS